MNRRRKQSIWLRRNLPLLIAAAALVLLILTTVFPFSVLRLFSEPMIALLFALCVLITGAIAGAFGDVFAEDGSLDRQKLGTVVFGDPAALETLNAIIYDRLPRELRRRMDGSDAPVVGIDAINLIESGLCGMCRRTVAVTAPPEVRVRRIMARDHIPEDYARLRVQAQKDEEFYRTHCTDVLVNDCADAAAFEQRAYRALETILKEEQV